MADAVVSAARSVATGDLLALGAGDTVVLHRSAKDRHDWTSILCALPVAVHRGAEVRWERNG